MLHVFNRKGLPVELADPVSCKVFGVGDSYGDTYTAQHYIGPFNDTMKNSNIGLRGDVSKLSRFTVLAMGLAFLRAYADQFHGTTRLCYRVLLNDLFKMVSQVRMSDVQGCSRIAKDALASVMVPTSGDYDTDWLDAAHSNNVPLDTLVNGSHFYVSSVNPALNFMCLGDADEMVKMCNKASGTSGIVCDLAGNKGTLSIVLRTNGMTPEERELIDKLYYDSARLAQYVGELREKGKWVDTSYVTITYDLADFYRLFTVVYNVTWAALLNTAKGTLRVFDQNDLVTPVKEYDIEDLYDGIFRDGGYGWRNEREKCFDCKWGLSNLKLINNRAFGEWLSEERSAESHRTGEFSDRYLRVYPCYIGGSGEICLSYRFVR